MAAYARPHPATGKIAPAVICAEGAQQWAPLPRYRSKATIGKPQASTMYASVCDIIRSAFLKERKR